MKGIWAILAFSLVLRGQTNILYPNVSGQVVQVLSGTGTSPTVLTTTANSFSAGDLVLVYSIWENTGTVNQYSALNSPAGVQRKICSASLTSTTVTLCDLSNSPVNTSNSVLPFSGYIRLASIGTLGAGPRNGMGAWGSPTQMQIAATIRDSTLTNISTSGGTATINYAFPHGLPSNCTSPGGCKVQVRNASCSNENGIKTITIASSTSATYVTTCGNATDTSSNLSVSAFGIDGQGPWEQVKFVALNFGTSANLDLLEQDTDTSVWSRWAADALYWFVDPAQTTSLSNAVTKYQHYEDFNPGPQYCGESNGPGCTFPSGNSRDPANFFILGAVYNFTQGYAILKATGQLVGTDVTNINNYLLNDIGTSCVHASETAGSGTITVSGTAVTFSTSQSLNPGDYIYYLSAGTTGDRWARIISGSGTSYVVTSNFGNVTTSPWFKGSHFTAVANSCGLTNYLLHSFPGAQGLHDQRTVIQPPPTGDVPSPYSPIAGQWILLQGDNRRITSSLGAVAIDDATADDSRGLLNLQADATWDYDFHFSEYIGSWGGDAKAAFRYTHITAFAGLLAHAISATSISGWPNVFAHTVGASKRIYSDIYSFLPNTSASDPYFSPWLDATPWNFESPNDGATLAAYVAYARVDVSSNYYQHFLNNQMGTAWTTPNNLFRWLGNIMLVFYDPNTPDTDYTATLPTQVQLADSDVSSCVGLGLTCNTGGASSFFLNGIARQQGIWSRTSWAGDTTVFGQNYNGWASSQSDASDHGAVIPGNYHLIRNISGDTGSAAYQGCLIGDDDGVGSSSPCTYAESTSGINQWRYSTSLEAGTQLIPNTPTSLGPGLLRWSGPNQFGDPTSRYMASSTDLSRYNAASDGIIYSNRHVAEFKTSDHFIAIYDEVSRGSGYAITGYTQYPQGAASGCCPGGSTSFSAGLLTSTNSEHQRVMTRWLAPAGTNSLAVINDGPTNNPGYRLPSAYRLRHCPSTNGTTCNTSATSMEAIQIHYITTDTNSTFTATLISPDSNWTCGQFTGAVDTKLACWSRGGTTHGSMTSFTPSFSGTGKFLFSGLSAGTYAITVGGTPVTGSPFTVLTGDNSVYFEASAGAVSINGSGPAVTVVPSVGGRISAGH